jgi:AIG2 family protein
MNWQQMQRRCPSSEFFCIARLMNYRFAIARHSRLRNCGTANIFAEHGSEVWGVVYDVNDRDLIILDSFEDGYQRKQILVHPANNGNRPLESLVYIAPKEEAPPPPNLEYKRLMIEGAAHWKLPQIYLAMLHKIQALE